MVPTSRRLLFVTVATLLIVSVQAQKKKAGPPQSVSVDSVTTSSVTLSWQPPKKVPRGFSISGYKILYRLQGGGSQKKLDIPDTGTYTITDLAAGSVYEVKMATITSNGKVGGFTSWLETTTGQEQAAPPPNPPQNVRASASGTSITIDWVPPQGSFDGYLVGYGINSPDENMIEVSQEELGTTLNGLQAGTTYQISLQSVRGGVQSPAININLETGVPVPSPPDSIRLRSTTDSIDVEWSHNAIDEQGVTGFELTVGPDSNPTEQAISLESNDRYTTVTGLQPEQVYVVSVKAMNQYGFSQPISDKISTQAARVQGPPPPTGMQTSSGPDNIEVAWGEPGGDVTSYILNVGPVSNPNQITEEIPRGTNFFRVDNLNPSTEYTVSIRSVNRNGQSQPMQSNVRTTAAQGPNPPSGIRMTSRSDAIEVEWGAARGDISGYRLNVASATEPNKFSQSFRPDVTSFTVPDLDPNTEYQVSLFSLGQNDVESQPLRQVIRTMNISPPSSINLRASDSTIEVMWPASEENVDGYNIQVAPAGSPTNVVAKETLSPLDDSYTFENMDPGTDYTVSLTSYKGDATSPPIQQTIRTRDQRGGGSDGGTGGGTGGQPRGVPRSPTGVSVNTEGNNLRVSWNPSQEDLSRYIVRAGRARSGSSDEIEQTVRSTKTQYLLRNLEPDTEYLVSVSAVNNRGESTPTMATGRTERPLPGRPEGLAASTTSNSATLTWRAPSTPIDGYTLSLGTATYPRQYSESLSPRTTIFTFEDLEPDTIYQAELQSYNDVGSSQPISSKLRTEPAPPRRTPPTPERIDLTSTPSRVNIRWAQAQGPVTGYRLTLTDPETGDVVNSVEVDRYQQNYAFTDLVPGKEYEVTIEAFNDDGYSDPQQSTVSTEPLPQGSLEPQNVEIVATGTQIDVSWQPPVMARGQHPHSFVVVAEAVDDDGETLGPRESITLHHSTREHTFYNLLPATNYRVSVAANHDGTLSTPVVQEVMTTIDGPIPPINIMADPASPTTMSVSWDFPVRTGPPQSSGGRRPDIYYTVRASSPAAGDVYANSREMTAVVEGLQPDTMYNIQVAMVFNGRMSDYSDPFAVRTFSNVDSRSPQFPTVTQVLLEIPENVHSTLNWLPPRDDADRIRAYNVEYTTAADPSLDNTTWSSVSGPAGDLGVVIPNLPTSATVSFKVQPVYRDGEKGPFTPVTQFSTPIAERPAPADEPCQSHLDVTRQRINQITERVVPPLGMPVPYCDQYFNDFPCVWSPVCMCIPRGTRSLGALPASVRPTDGAGCGSSVQRDDPDMYGDEPMREVSPAPCQQIFDATLEAIKESHKNSIPLMASALPNCREDGYYDDIQCMGSMCVCVDKLGQPTGKMTQIWNVNSLNCDGL